MKNKFVGLIILDGWGINADSYGNAILQANPTNYFDYVNNYPYTTLNASGEYVGLPDGQIGNSEVGHLNIGAGKVVYQSLPLINNAIISKEFFKNPALNKVIEHVNSNNSTMHLMGLLSDGGVHSHINHLFALIDMLKQNGVKNACVHCFMDGRDTYRDSGSHYMQLLLDKLAGTNYKIATVSGRYYGMDREQNYDRVKLFYDAMVYGKAKYSDDPITALHDSYNQNVFDEFVKPVVITSNGKPNAVLQENDGIIFYNYREDRAREITNSLVEPNFTQFDRTQFNNVEMCTFSCYDKSFVKPIVAFPRDDVEVNLSQVISANSLCQFKIAETTKYAHVTYFLNGGIEKPYLGEDRFLIETIKDKSFEDAPQMRAKEITDKAIECINTKQYSFMALNYSNCDMIGHTGNLQAAIEAIKVLNEQLKRLVDSIISIGGVAVVIADHGNAENMLDKSGRVLTDHTTNPVPCIVISEPKQKIKLINGGSLCNVAPTILKLLDLPIPSEFTAKPLF